MVLKVSKRARMIPVKLRWIIPGLSILMVFLMSVSILIQDDDIIVKVGSTTTTNVSVLELPHSTISRRKPTITTPGIKRSMEPSDFCFRETNGTTAWRCLPSYLMIGFPKCGSSSLFRLLKQHPLIHLMSDRKEVHFWNRPRDGIMARLPRFIAKHSPRLTSDELREGHVVADHTPGYIWRVPYRCEKKEFGCGGLKRVPAIYDTIMNVAFFLPRSTRLLVVVRDPVARSYSHFWHFLNRGPRQFSRPATCFHALALKHTRSLSQCFADRSRTSSTNLVSQRMRLLLPLQSKAIQLPSSTVDFTKQGTTNHKNPYSSNYPYLVHRGSEQSNEEVVNAYADLVEENQEMSATVSLLPSASGGVRGVAEALRASRTRFDPIIDLEESACAWGVREGKAAASDDTRMVALSLFAVFLEVWLLFLGRSDAATGQQSRFCVIALDHFADSINNGENYLKHNTSHMKITAMRRIEDCLRLSKYERARVSNSKVVTINRHGTRKNTPPMQESTRKVLDKFFRPFNERLRKLDLFGPLSIPSWLDLKDTEETEAIDEEEIDLFSACERGGAS